MDPPTNAATPDTGQTAHGQDKSVVKLDTTDMSGLLRHMAVHQNHAPLSAPATPSLRTPENRRPSHPAASPISAKNTPPRRASSSASVNRPPPSPRLMRKSSRSSLGTAVEDNDRRPTPKRSISNLISGLREAQSTMESIEEPIPLTAPDIATEHFKRELLGHSQVDTEAETVVILHDACYGHRFSRLKTSKASLNMIVERPERLHASILGASAAYVRLGGHHAAGKHAPYPGRTHLSSPPFKIRTSTRALDITSSYVTNVHGTEWMSELQIMCHSAQEKLANGTKELARPPPLIPGQPLKEQLHEGDLYLAPESLGAFQGALGGVADAIDTVFGVSTTTNRAFVAVRPPGHHCSADLPSGFCWLNNVHIGIEYAAQTYGLTHAAIFDFDLHHGDGSQSITWARNSKNNEKRLNAKPTSKLKLDPDIGYYSIHDINSYPCESGEDAKVQAASLCIENAHGQSIWNVHLQPWKNEAAFWKLYEDRYLVLLEKAKVFLEYHAGRYRSEGKVQPKAAIFISAGFDASEWEGAGMQRHKVNVPTEFYARFTQDIIKLAQSIDGCDGRVISVLEGGYSDRALCSGVLSHLSGLCATPITKETNGVDALMGQLNGLSINGAKETWQYDKTWWSSENLTALEDKVYPPPPQQGKKFRSGPQPTYATPTESFAYKVIDPHKFARSISGTMREVPMPSRPPTPPPPEVDWVVATQELSKLLIPTDRQTKSCTHEDLAAPRVKKERQSAGPILTTETTQPRQLRDRKAKGPVYAESTHSDDLQSLRSVPASRSESRASRRETISTLPVDDFAAADPQKRSSRRLSAGSTLSATDGTLDANAPPVPSLPPAMKAASTTKGAMRPPPSRAPSRAPTSSSNTTNKQTRAPSRALKPTPPPTSSTAVPPPSRSALSSQPVPKTSDIDNLTSGLKKITLKVSSTKEEHDRKQKEKMDAERKARALKGAETRRINAAKKKATEEAAAPTSASTLPTPTATTTTTSGLPTLAQLQHPFIVPATQTSDPPANNESTISPTTIIQVPSVEKSAGSLQASDLVTAGLLPPPSHAESHLNSSTLPVPPVAAVNPDGATSKNAISPSFDPPAEELEFPEYNHSPSLTTSTEQSIPTSNTVGHHHVQAPPFS